MNPSQIHQTASVRFRTCPAPLTGRALFAIPRGRRRRAAARPNWSGWSRNLITDTGLDMVASEAWCRCFMYFAVGTGTRPTKRDSGNITATRAGNTVTASAGFFVAEDVGRVLKFDSGSSSKITGFTSASVVTVADAGAVDAAEFTVHYTSDSTHEAEYARFYAGLNGAGQRSTRIDGATIIYRRTGLSGAFAATKTLREIGWSPNAGAGSALFGRALIPGGGDTVTAGQQYMVQVELSVTLSPAVPTAAANVGTGCNSAGYYGFTWWNYTAAGSRNGDCSPLSYIDTNSDGSIGVGMCEPARVLDINGLVFLGGAPVAVTALSLGGGQAADWMYNKGTVAKAAYVSGSRFIEYTRALGASDYTGGVGGIRIGASNNYECWRHVFAAPIAKSSLQTFTCKVRIAWDRVLVN